METDTESSPLSPAILRGLGDRSYDKRKNAALEVTSVVKSLIENNDKPRILIVINLLSSDFIRSKNVNHRKGGLIGLASSSIGLINHIEEYLYVLIPPVLECFDDIEPRVCYYACESLYNISKVSRLFILKYFNSIFDGLCKLFAHVDSDVRNGASLLDRLIKDIVTETEQFDIESFIPLLQKHIKRTKPYIRQLLVSWISVLNSVPDIHLLDYLPEFLEGLFNMVSDSNKEIKTMTENVLNEFLQEISQQHIRNSTNNTDSLDSANTLIVQDIVTASVVNTATVTNIPTATVTIDATNINSTSVPYNNTNTSEIIILDYSRILTILIMQSYSKGGTKLVTMYDQLLISIMFCISDSDPEIQKQTKICNSKLMSLCQSTIEYFDLKPIVTTLLMELSSDHVISRLTSLQWFYMLHNKNSVLFNKLMPEILPNLLKTLSDISDEVILYNLKVLSIIASEDSYQFFNIFNQLICTFYQDRNLLERRGALIIRKFCTLLPPRKIYTTLAAILNSNGNSNNNNNFDGKESSAISTEYSMISNSNNSLLESTGVKNITTTTTISNTDVETHTNNVSTSIDMTATTTNDIHNNINNDFIYDLDYLSIVVQTLNLILLTAPELYSLRQLLKYSNSNNTNHENNNSSSSSMSLTFHPDKELFINLFKCWSHNPVALFSLCLLSQAYDVSALLVHKFAELEITVGFLIQLDKLIQLIESPVFLPLRLQLLDANSYQHMYLLKSLYGLLMILPQSQSYRVLSERLSTASTLHMHIGFTLTYQTNQINPQSIVLQSSNSHNYLDEITTVDGTSNTNATTNTNSTSSSNSNKADNITPRKSGNSNSNNHIRSKSPTNKNKNKSPSKNMTSMIDPIISNNDVMNTKDISSNSIKTGNSNTIILTNEQLIQLFLNTQAEHTRFKQSLIFASLDSSPTEHATSSSSMNNLSERFSML